MARILAPEPFPKSFICGSNSGRYVQGTPTEMMRLYWKCKSFNVSGSYINYVFDDPVNPPQNTSWQGTITSIAGSETELVCGSTLFVNTQVSGLVNIAYYLDFGFTGSDFYFNSNPNQEVVKLYGNFNFETDQDDTSGINTEVGGSLSPFTINGFQVYEDGSAVNYNATSFFGSPLIQNFTASFTEGDLWPYEA